MIEREDFAKMTKALALLVPRFAPKFDDRDTMNLWFKTFEEYDLNSLKRAYNLIKEKADDFPSIKEIIEIYESCGGKKPQPKRDELPSDSQMHKRLLEYGLIKPSNLIGP